MDRLIKFSEFLMNYGSYDIESALYVQSKQWTLNTDVAVLDPDETEEPNGNFFQFKEENCLFYALQVSTILEVIEYCSEQNPNLSQSDLLRSIIYYYENDAFLVCEN